MSPDYDRSRSTNELANSCPFCKFTVPRRYQTSGAYALTADGELRYIGERANLAARFNAGYGNISPKNCYRGGQETNCHLNNLLPLKPFHEIRNPNVQRWLRFSSFV
jgi:hypothetical protein